MLVLVVHPSLQASTLKEFVEQARTRAGGLTIANAGSGTPTHLTAVLFAQAAGVTFAHLPYRGAAPATNDLLAGHVHAMFNNPVNAVPQAKANALRAHRRQRGEAALPHARAANDLPRPGYPGFETRTWFGLFGPAGVAPDTVAKLYADTRWALGSPDVAEKLAAQGWDVLASSPADFAMALKSELDKWSAVIKSAKIKGDN